ncbi:BUD13 homolog isoform X2 [Myxocyprinus asiaticus]|uniref:BUD13 homolog isoform X2 n=1 Tax=Myxocyprinus asiaticus TaxID=70543 RepID=UPI002222CBB5|nr:BUD13 homolog isoform X2 [Myxocyprinus asiaticus]
MATSTGISKSAAPTKADYLKRYLSNDEAGKKSKEKKFKKKRPKPTESGMKIVDDDIDWRQLAAHKEEENKDEDEEEEAPVIAEVIDERPDVVKQLEAFRTSNKWKVMGDTDPQGSQDSILDRSSETDRGRVVRLDSPEGSPVRRVRHDSPDLSPKRVRHDSPDLSPQRRKRHDSPDLSSQRHRTENKNRRHDSSSPSPLRKSIKISPSRSQRQHNKESPHRKKTKANSLGDLSPPRRRAQTSKGSDSDQSPPRRCPHERRGSKSDLSPPRKQDQRGGGSDSDLSPPRKKHQGRSGSDSDLSPPRRIRSLDGQAAPQMLSGGAAGLVSVDTLRKEQEEIRRREKHNQPLEEQSRNVETVFRDKSGRKRDLDSERVELSKKAVEKAEKDEKYAEWGKGLAQGEMQQQNLADAMREAQKPLARHIDDEDLDRMLREQERDGDPMAAMLRKKKEKNTKLKGIKDKPCYRGPPPPPNRFNIMPGYRWDGVDRSNGFEQKRYSRMADKKAVQEMAYKWSVEDM